MLNISGSREAALKGTQYECVYEMVRWLTWIAFSIDQPLTLFRNRLEYYEVDIGSGCTSWIICRTESRSTQSLSEPRRPDIQRTQSDQNLVSCFVLLLRHGTFAKYGADWGTLPATAVGLGDGGYRAAAGIDGIVVAAAVDRKTTVRYTTCGERGFSDSIGELLVRISGCTVATELAKSGRGSRSVPVQHGVMRCECLNLDD